MTEDQIDTFYELEIADRKTDKLRSSAQQIIAANQAEEPGILVYNVYISEDEKLLTFGKPMPTMMRCGFIRRVLQAAAVWVRS